MEGSTDRVRAVGVRAGPSRSPGDQYRRLRAVFIAGAVLSGVALSATFIAFQLHAERVLVDNIRSQAQAHVREFEAVRKYVSDSGGVYVRESETVRPNPHLGSPHVGSLRAPDGTRYVLQNSPLVAQGISALLEAEPAEDSIVIRMVQREPLNPQNTPDRWETGALARLKSGETEVSGFETHEGRVTFRYAHPIECSGPCGRCHPNLKDGSGEVFGASVIKMDVTNTIEQIRQSRLSSVVALVLILAVLTGATWYVVVWLLGGLRKAQVRLDTLARTDELTGLPNRREGMRMLEREVERARREDGRLGVVLLDLDHFKLVNDLLGHAVGDLALQAVGRAFSRAARAYDTAARYGGEEFLLVLPGADREGATEAVERVRHTITAECRSLPGLEWPITSSAGVVLCEPGIARTADELLHLADRALYAAKGRGRDRTVVSGDLCETSMTETAAKTPPRTVRDTAQQEI